jgi:hypothetical protein
MKRSSQTAVKLFRSLHELTLTDVERANVDILIDKLKQKNPWENVDVEEKNAIFTAVRQQIQEVFQSTEFLRRNGLVSEMAKWTECREYLEAFHVVPPVVNMEQRLIHKLPCNKKELDDNGEPVKKSMRQIYMDADHMRTKRVQECLDQVSRLHKLFSIYWKFFGLQGSDMTDLLLPLDFKLIQKHYDQVTFSTKFY